MAWIKLVTISLLIVGCLSASLNDVDKLNQVMREKRQFVPDLNVLGNDDELTQQIDDTSILTSYGRTRRAISDRKWPLGQIPYKIAGNFSPDHLSVIYNSMNAYRNLTCIRFVPWTNEIDFISIESPATGCGSKVGRIGGKQTLNLSVLFGCVTAHITLHEMMHTIGFNHEWTRADRDDYVNIIVANIVPAQLATFTKRATTDAFGVQYDFASVMHTFLNKYSIDKNLQTIVPKVPQTIKIGGRVELSPGDIQRIKAMYNCT